MSLLLISQLLSLLLFCSFQRLRAASPQTVTLCQNFRLRSVISASEASFGISASESKASFGFASFGISISTNSVSKVFCFSWQTPVTVFVSHFLPRKSFARGNPNHWCHVEVCFSHSRGRKRIRPHSMARIWQVRSDELYVESGIVGLNNSTRIFNSIQKY